MNHGRRMVEACSNHVSTILESYYGQGDLDMISWQNYNDNLTILQSYRDVFSIAYQEKDQSADVE